MKTTHRLFESDSRNLPLSDSSVELMVTSPPYPMVEMWDEMFKSQSEKVATALSNGNGMKAFEEMHQVLDSVWTEIERVLCDGGIACINIGPATRSIEGDSFKCYPNHSRITRTFLDLGFTPLPEILWRKPVNSPTKFVGSGMRPPNAYPTLEHEYILLFRNGDTRSPPSETRDESAYFYTDRNQWFSDLWDDIIGEDQSSSSRDRSAEFPVQIPYRLVNMFSIFGDTVLDPFVGTGTTMVAAACAGRNSIGIDINADLFNEVFEKFESAQSLSETLNEQRINRAKQTTGNYQANSYEMSVRSKQELDITLQNIKSIEYSEKEILCSHEKHGLKSQD